MTKNRVYRITVATADGEGRIYTTRASSINALPCFLKHWHTIKVELVPSRGGQ
jgi:hypothetical protein